MSSTEHLLLLDPDRVEHLVDDLLVPEGSDAWTIEVGEGDLPTILLCCTIVWVLDAVAVLLVLVDVQLREGRLLLANLLLPYLPLLHDFLVELVLKHSGVLETTRL